jgi:osmotically-inducible protein OsmY
MKIRRSPNISAAAFRYTGCQVDVLDTYRRRSSISASRRTAFPEVRLIQSNGKADSIACARIRQMIVADKSLSLYAQSIEIAAVSGEVILKGFVRSELEKQKIACEVTAIASECTIINDLVVRSRQARGQLPIPLSQAEKQKRNVEQEYSILRNLWGIRNGRGSGRSPASEKR